MEMMPQSGLDRSEWHGKGEKDLTGRRNSMNQKRDRRLHGAHLWARAVGLSQNDRTRVPGRKPSTGDALEVQWLGLGAVTAVTWV